MTLSFPSLDPGPITRVVYISLAPPEVASPFLLPRSFVFWAFPEMLVPAGPGISSSWKSENLVLPHAPKACLLLGATTESYNCHHKFPWLPFPPQLVQWLPFWVILPDNKVCCANSTPLLLYFIIQMMGVNTPSPHTCGNAAEMKADGALPCPQKALHLWEVIVILKIFKQKKK